MLISAVISCHPVGPTQKQPRHNRYLQLHGVYIPLCTYTEHAVTIDVKSTLSNNYGDYLVPTE